MALTEDGDGEGNVKSNLEPEASSLERRTQKEDLEV